ncbi:MAG: hypothetical protein GTN74_00815 [Proteobacteria bacterium]|nr:hypothetical protein [Pseudomonadota bacterium]NIS67559.1 hypothetical protein [Pseudomonadota bacterium]
MGWGADLIAAGHQWFNHLISCLGRVGLAAFVGDLFGGKGFSLEVIVYANEVIEQARRFARGFEVDDTDLLLDEIAQVGPGGNFLASDLTLSRFRQAYFESEIFPQLTMEDWQARGCPRTHEFLKDHVQRLIASLKAPEDHSDVMAKGEGFINKLIAR